MPLTLTDLTKYYPPARVALDHLSLEAREGVLGLLGPNGAGKSSLMEILAANLDFEEGSAVLDGTVDVRRTPTEWRRRLGYMPQTFDFPTHTSGREMLEEAALLLGLSPRRLAPRIDQLLERVNLAAAAERPCATYSRGMKQRLGLALSLLHQPRLLLLDEPTAGLDPVERVIFRELLAEAARDRVAILSTHIVADVERCCDTVVVLRRGRMLFNGAPRDLAAKAHGKVWEVTVPGDRVEEIAAQCRVVSIAAEGRQATIRLVAPAAPWPDARPAEPLLEDGYLLLLEQDQKA